LYVVQTKICAESATPSNRRESPAGDDTARSDFRLGRLVAKLVSNDGSRWSAAFGPRFTRGEALYAAKWRVAADTPRRARRPLTVTRSA